ncbi:MAG: helix-turn-helix transcriptional regulator [Tannerellaceae bacterium]|jgi:AraC-like DNA-binding protein|nr:helix-turn-helix transcriptional regulator [Tannerellaceae bacterium]
MEAIRVKDNSDYFSYDDREGNVIEVRKIQKGDKWDDTSYHHTLIFVLEGTANMTVANWEPRSIRKGLLSYVQSGDTLSVFATSNVVFIVIRTLTLTEMCECLKLGDFYHTMDKESVDIEEISLNVILPSIWHYLKGLYTAIGDGIRSKSYFDAKIKELYLLMRNYYSKQELYRIFLPALSNDIAFSDAVKTSWCKYKTIEDLSEAMGFTPASFYRHFTKTFGCSAQQWITTQKKIRIYKELIDSDCHFKELADKYWFSSVQSFYNWCVKTYNRTPGDIRRNL